MGHIQESNEMIKHIWDKLIMIPLAQPTGFSGACTCTCVCACTITNGTNIRSSNVQILFMKHANCHTFKKILKDSHQMINH